ncbi:MAG TPA: DUF6247 family protein [Mycobacteriales bacterium]|jgi:hypothetical protein|nr:DUF6247 family protein [Mycobacteriales bacterium]
MTSRIERSGPAIRDALAGSSPDECRRFEVEFQQALATAGETFDLGPVEALLDRWWGIAAIRGNPLTATEQGLVAKARAGDDSGWDIPARLPTR